MEELSEAIDLAERGRVRIFAEPGELFADAAAAFAVVVQAAVEARGRAAVAFSGGETPRALYRFLAAEPNRHRLPWPRIHAFWGDERGVPPEHAESNFRLARETLFDHVPLPPENVHRIRGEISAAAAAQEYEADLQRFFAGDAPPRFDVVWLGLGRDGHTASLFPGSPALAETQRLAVAVSGPPPLLSPRVTLTLPVINRARHVFFLVLGADKSAVLAEVLTGEPRAQTLPAEGVRPEAGELVFWVDRAAASDFRARRAGAFR